MKKVWIPAGIALLTACLIMLSFIAIFSGSMRGYRDKIMALFVENEAKLSEAVSTGDFSAIRKIRGIDAVEVNDDYIEFSCGGRGMGASTSYYGFFYSAEDEINAWFGQVKLKQMTEIGQGQIWQEDGGDNHWYVERIGTHFFYFEAHF